MQMAMNNAAPRGLRGWWTSPSRSGLRLTISPVEYRHLRALGHTRIASAIVLTGLGVVTLSFGAKDRRTYGWAIWFLGGAAANAAYGYWELSIVPETDQHSATGPEAGSLRPSSSPPARRHPADETRRPL